MNKWRQVGTIKDSVILGVSLSHHDGAACLVKDGKILCAIELERLAKIKKLSFGNDDQSLGYFGEEYNNTSQPHNGRAMLLGNCQGQFTKKNIMLQPEVGDFYIFPYDLEHLVYPFRGDGMRRSLSVNYDVFHRHVPKK